MKTERSLERLSLVRAHPEHFDAVDFLEVEAIAVWPIIVNDVEAVDHLGDIELEASIDISLVIVDEVEAVDLWKSRP